MAQVQHEDVMAVGFITLVVPSLSIFEDAGGKLRTLSSPVHNIGGFTWFENS